MHIAAARYSLLLFLGFEIDWAIPKLSLAGEDNSCVGPTAHPKAQEFQMMLIGINKRNWKFL